MFGPVFWGNVDRHSGSNRCIYHCLVDAFGMHIDFNFASTGSHTVKNGLPKIVTTLAYSALSVYAKSYSADGRTILQQLPNSVPAIWAMGFVCKSLDRVIWIRTIDPFVSVHPY